MALGLTSLFFIFLIYKAYLDCYKNKKTLQVQLFLKKIYLKNIRDLTKEINKYKYIPRLSTPKIREFSKIDLDIEISESKFYF